MERLKQAIEDEWCALSQKFIDRSISEWRRRPEYVIQQNGRYNEHYFKHVYSPRLYTAFLLQFMYICELRCFKLRVYKHAVLCGTTYRNTVTSSKVYIRLFDININLCVQKSLHSVKTSEMYKHPSSILAHAIYTWFIVKNNYV